MRNLSNKELVKYELIGYLLSGNIDIDKNNLEFTTENDYNINRFSKLLSNLLVVPKVPSGNLTKIVIYSSVANVPSDCISIYPS